MKLKIKVGELLAAVDKVCQTVDKSGKKTEAIGSANIFVDAYKTEKAQVVYFYSTNMTAEVNDKVTCTVEEPGKSLIDPDQLRAGLAHRDPEEIAEISLVSTGKGKNEVSRIRVKIGKNHFHLGYDLTGTEVMAKRMKAIPFRQEPAYTMPGKEMAEFVRRGQFCIPRENEGVNRFELSGMKLMTTDKGYEAHATDGHVCARIRVKGEKGPKQMNGVLIPNASLPSLAKLVKKEDEIKVIEGEKNGNGNVAKLFFKMGDSTFFGTRLLEGQFPDIEGALKNHAAEYWLTVDRELLKTTLQRAAAFDDQRQVNLEITNEKIVVRAKSQVSDLEEEVEIENVDMPEGLKLTRTINLDYLLNIAQTSSQERLKLGVSDYTQKAKVGRALIVDDADDSVETLYAVMPVAQAKA